METKHTPTPWVIAALEPSEVPEIWGYNDSGKVCQLSTYGAFQAAQTEAEVHANAAFICQAVNAYASNQQTIKELKEALEAFLESVEGPACVEAKALDGSNAWHRINDAASIARAALAKANEGEK